jgi:hypothetical protein
MGRDEQQQQRGRRDDVGYRRHAISEGADDAEAAAGAIHQQGHL